MARWTQTTADVHRLIKSHGMLSACMAKDSFIQLIDGTIIEGWVKGGNFGNNGPQGGPGFSPPTSWYGEITLITASGQTTIDLLDIEFAAPKGAKP